MEKIKLSFEDLEKELNVISSASLAHILGGTVGDGPLPNGYCVFNSLGYINEILGYQGRNAENVLSNFYNQKGMGDFEFDSNGNVDSLKFGSGDNDMNAFINEHYNTKGYASTHGEIIENLKNGTVYMAASGNHNVVVTGYNQSSGKYTVLDATTDETYEEVPTNMSNFLGIDSVSTDTTVPWGADEMDGIPTTTIPGGIPDPDPITTFADID